MTPETSRIQAAAAGPSLSPGVVEVLTLKFLDIERRLGCTTDGRRKEEFRDRHERRFDGI